MNNLFPNSYSRQMNGDAAMTSLMRMIKLNEESIEMGTDICEKLSHQKKQIYRIATDLENIDEKVVRCENTVGKMKSITGIGIRHHFEKLFSKNPKVKKIALHSKSPKAPKGKQQSSPNSENLTGDQIDKALEIVSQQVKQLKSLSLQISNELDCHNQLLTKTNENADIAISNIKTVTYEEEEII